MELFDVNIIMRAIKNVQLAKKKKKCKEEEDKGENHNFRNNMTENITKIESIIYLQYALQSFKLIFIIMNATYVTGMLWIITCSIHKEFYGQHFH